MSIPIIGLCFMGVAILAASAFIGFHSAFKHQPGKEDWPMPAGWPVWLFAFFVGSRMFMPETRAVNICDYVQDALFIVLAGALCMVISILAWVGIFTVLQKLARRFLAISANPHKT